MAEKTRAGAHPAGIVVGSGSVWVSNSGEAKVWRYNPAAFHGRPARRPVSVGKRPTGIAAGDRAIWVANSAGDSVSRIDPNDGASRSVPVGEGPTHNRCRRPDAVWVVEQGRRNPLAHRPGDEQGGANRPDRPGAAIGIVFADGLLWVTVQAP